MTRMHMSFGLLQQIDHINWRREHAWFSTLPSSPLYHDAATRIRDDFIVQPRVINLYPPQTARNYHHGTTVFLLMA